MTEQSQDWQAAFAYELSRAEQARAAGNEGQARVCARRAAGVLAGEYLRRSGLPPSKPSAYDRLGALAGLAEAPPEARQIAERLRLRVTTEWRLPVEADLLADARRLKEILFLQV